MFVTVNQKLMINEIYRFSSYDFFVFSFLNELFFFAYTTTDHENDMVYCVLDTHYIKGIVQVSFVYDANYEGKC